MPLRRPRTIGWRPKPTMPTTPWPAPFPAGETCTLNMHLIVSMKRTRAMSYSVEWSIPAELPFQTLTSALHSDGSRRHP